MVMSLDDLRSMKARMEIQAEEDADIMKALEGVGVFWCHSCKRDARENPDPEGCQECLSAIVMNT